VARAQPVRWVALDPPVQRGLMGRRPPSPDQRDRVVSRVPPDPRDPMVLPGRREIPVTPETPVMLVPPDQRDPAGQPVPSRGQRVRRGR
jgi:hypothetical protein